MTQEYLPEKVDIYISYTQRVEEDKKIAKAFYSACEKQKHPRLIPHIDSKDLGLHADIYQYMSKLSASRFVVCVFSPAYFQSENCVLEFAGLCHNGYMQDRVFPLFVDYFFNDDDREKKMSVLIDNENLADRVKKNTGKKLGDLLDHARHEYMDKLAGIVHQTASQHEEDQFESFFSYFLDRIEQHNEKRFNDHTRQLVEQVSIRLKHFKLKGFVPSLAYELQCSANESTCAEKLFKDDALDGIFRLIKAGKEHGLDLKKNSPFKEIVGFLLVSTIKPNWWLLNEFRLQRDLTTGNGVKAGGIFPHEIEIVMARLTKRSAMYEINGLDIQSKCLIGKGQVFAFTGDLGLRRDSYIKAFYEDITKVHLGTEAAATDILQELRGRLKNRLIYGRQYFYIIPSEDFEELNSVGVIEAINEKLDKMVQFVVVGGSSGDQPEVSVLSVDSDRVKGFLSEILR